MAALAMAILLNGMDARELARWTAAMIASGERLALPDVGRPLVDKHSTGGVGDAVSLLVDEDRADHIDLNFGCPVPKVTRRGGGSALP